MEVVTAVASVVETDCYKLGFASTGTLHKSYPTKVQSKALEVPECTKMKVAGLM